MSEMPEPTVTAADPMLRILSTEDVSAAHRRNYWMAHAYRAVEARLAPDVVPKGRLSLCGDPDSGQFVRCESSPVQTSLTSARLRAQLSDEHIAICWIGRGNFNVEDEHGMQTRLHTGDLFMFDCGQPMRGAWSDSDAHYLRLPRRLVRQVLASDPADYAGVVTPLSSDGMAPFLCAQLQKVGEYGANLSARDLSAVLQFTVELSLRLLEAHFGSARNGLAPNEDKLRAAYQYLRAHAHQPDVTVDSLAQALHCSRAQLYRLFENEPLSIMATLKDIRLLRARDALVQSGRSANVAAVAYACGFSDPSVFGKLFRQKFGTTPGEVARAQAMSGRHSSSA